MDKKAQIGVGALILTFVGIITALVILEGGLTTPIGDMTSIKNYNNDSFTLVTGASHTLVGKYIESIVLKNASNNETIGATNYTVTNNVILSDGTLGATITGAAAIGASYNNSAVNATYTYQDVSYISEVGGRTIAGMIIMFAALAIAVFAMVPVLRNGVIDLVKG